MRRTAKQILTIPCQSGLARGWISRDTLGDGMEKLKEEAVGIHKEIGAVDDLMPAKMLDLRDTSDEMGSVVDKSLENQMRLFDG